jgi:hypothetical protein
MAGCFDWKNQIIVSIRLVERKKKQEAEPSGGRKKPMREKRASASTIFCAVSLRGVIRFGD